MSGSQCRPRAPLSPSRTPPGVRACTITPSPCPLVGAGQSSLWPRPLVGAGRDSHSPRPDWACPRADSPPSLIARQTEASRLLPWQARQAWERQGGEGATGGNYCSHETTLTSNILRACLGTHLVSPIPMCWVASPPPGTFELPMANG